MLRSLAVLAFLFAAGAAPAQAQTVTAQKAMEMLGGYFSLTALASAVIELCENAPEGETKDKSGQIVRWLGYADYRAVVARAGAYANAQQVLKRKIVAAVPSAGREIETALSTVGGGYGALAAKLRDGIKMSTSEHGPSGVCALGKP